MSSRTMLPPAALGKNKELGLQRGITGRVVRHIQ